MRRGFKTWAERQAVEQRLMLGLNAISPLPAERLAKQLRITIQGPHAIPAMSMAHLAQLLEHDHSSWSAVTLDTPLGRLIIHNTVHSPARQQSNIMHEIAHVLCNHTPMRLLPIAGPSILLRDYDPDLEEEASWYGACLQLSRPALLWAVRCGMDEAEMAFHFGASIEQVRYRRQVSGVNRQLSSLRSQREV